ncbi:MAG: hypothetical protein ACLFU4_06910 [Opitutales bacterium]
MLSKEYEQGQMQRRGFLARMAAVLGVPLALPANAQSQSSGQTNAPGQYYRPHQSAFSTEVDWSPWQHRARLPIWESSMGNEPIFIEAIHRAEVLYGTYDRWGDPAIPQISPIQVFQVEPEDPLEIEDASDQPYYHDVIDTGPTYLIAWDHDRQAPRTFRAEHFSPYFTAPWMQRYAGEMSESEWRQCLRRTQDHLRKNQVQPVKYPV